MRGFFFGLVLVVALVFTILSIRPGGIRRQLRMVAHRLGLVCVPKAPAHNLTLHAGIELSAVSYVTGRLTGRNLPGESRLMQLRLPTSRPPVRPVMTVFGAVAFGVLLAGGGPQVQSLWDRPACAEKVMQAVSTDSTISGSYGCFTTNMQTGLQTIGVDS